MEDNKSSQELIEDALHNVSKETSKRRSSLKKSLFKNRHKVHCATTDLDEPFIEDRTKYDEHVVTLPSKPPAPSYTNTVRYKFIQKKKKKKKPKPKPPPSIDSTSQTESTATLTESDPKTESDPETETNTETESDPETERTPEKEDPDEPLKKPKLEITPPNIVAYIHELPRPVLRITTPELFTYLNTVTLIQTPIEIIAYIPTPPNLQWTSLDHLDIPSVIMVSKNVGTEDGRTPTPPPVEDPGSPDPKDDDPVLNVVISNSKQGTPEGSDVKVILMHIEKLMQLCLSVHGQCPADNSQLLAFIKEVHQDLIQRLNALKQENDEKKKEEEQRKSCLCAWLRIHISTSEQDAYMYTVNPRCPRCTLCQQGRQLLKAAGLKPNGFKDLWLPLGTVILCLETDDDDMCAQVLEKEIPDELITKVNAAQLSLLPGPHDEGTVTSVSDKWYRGDEGLTSVFRLLVFMGKLWGAPRCVLLMLRWLKTPASILQEVERLQSNITIHNNNMDPVSEKVVQINIVNNQAFSDKEKKEEMGIKCIFLAAKKRNVVAFKILLDGPSNSSFPKGATLVDLKSDKEPLPENNVDDPREEADRRTVFELLIDLCYASYQHNGKEEDCFLEMLDYIYDPTAIRKWSRLGETPRTPRRGRETTKHDERTREALSDLILGEPGEDRTTMLDYAAENGTGGVVKRILGNHPYRRPDRDNQGQSTHCYLADGLENILEKLNKRASKEVIGPVLEVEPLRTMVNDKWACYKPYYIGSLLWYLTFMAIFTLCAVFRPINAPTVSAMYQTTEDYFRLFGEILVIICLCILFYTIVQEVRVLRTFLKPWNRYDLYVYVNMLVFILTIVAVILRFTLNENEDILLALALFCGWTNVVHRVAAFKATGMFAIIMHHCIMKDFIPGFIWVFLIVLLGLSTATYTVYQTAPEDIQDFPNSTYWTTPFSLFKLTFGLLETEYATETRWGGIGVVLFLLYLLLINVILFNLLISMLGNTYQNVYDLVNQHWIQIRLSYVLLVEKWWPHLKIHYTAGEDSRCSSLACCLSSLCPKLRGVYGKDGQKRRYVCIPAEKQAKSQDAIYIM